MKAVYRTQWGEEGMLETTLKSWQNVFAAMCDGIWLLDPEGRVVQSNGKFEHLLGINMEDVVGQYSNRAVHCTSEFIEGCPFKRMKETGMRELAELENKERGLWLQVTVDPIRDESGEIKNVLHIVRDITELKRAEEDAKQQFMRISLLNQITRAIAQRQDLESIFRAVLGQLEEHLPMDIGSVLLFDPQTDTLTVAARGPKSQQLAAELGIPQGMVIPVAHTVFGTCIKGEVVYQPDTAQADRPILQKLAQAGIRSGVVVPLVVEGKIIGALSVGRNKVDGFSSADCEFLRMLSEHVALAAHHAQLNQDLRRAYDDLRQTQRDVMQQERLRALGQMASGIAHDINNALSPIVSFTNLLLMSESNLSERTKGYLKDILTASTDIVHNVARMRELYRKREEREPLLPVNLNRLVRQVLDLARPRWRDIPQECGIMVEIHTELDPDLPWVPGIESEIREALTNLIFNAVDSMPQGGTVTIRTRVGGHGIRGATHVVLEVTDTGMGMDEETRQRCLEPFFSTKGERGTGLGLAMVYGVMERHEGEIDIESESGRGTTMRLIFPLRGSVEATGSARPEAAAPLPSLRILFIDDEPLLRKVVQEILENDGHAVEVADGGQAGLDAFRAAKERGEPFEVIITDLGMPHVDGNKVASTVKRESPATPVILLTGWGMRMKADGNVPAPVDYVLSKPPKVNGLRHALAQVAQPSIQSHEAFICSEVPTFFKRQLKKPASVKRKGHILIAEDNELTRKALQNLLSDLGFRVTTAQDGQEALDLFSDQHDLVLTDLKMPRLDGLGLLKALKKRAPQLAVIFMSAYATIESAVEATKEGAYGYLLKPINQDALLHSIRQALEERKLQRENELLRRELEQSYRFHDLIGKSPKMKELFRLLEGIAESESTILLQGESGTGKELVARAIHSMSPRREKPFVALNCGGLAETLLESELFGHVRGAFTGAVAEKKGLFPVAHGGTLFLDEIGETPPSMQVKLLRALEEGEVRPVGGTRSIQINLRFIAATNRDMEEAVRLGVFRADLFYRLNVITLVLPPLRERIEDIPLLVDYFLAKYDAKLKKRVREVSPGAMACLLDYPWPGNIRELENCIERGVVLTQGEVLLPEVLPPQVKFQGKGAQEEEARGTLEGLTRQAIVEALIQARGNKRLASQILGISESTLYRKLKAYGLLKKS